MEGEELISQWNPASAAVTESSSLPRGWQLVPFEEACEILDSYREPVNNKDRQKRIEGKSISELYPYYGATGQVGYIDDYKLDGTYVLLGEDGAPFLEFGKSKAYVVSGKFWVNNHAHILAPRIDHHFFCHYLNTYDYSQIVTGTTRLKLTQAAMKRIAVPVPPAEEQRRIVAKIEELFSELDKGIESLQTARAQLKTYRQSLLKAAFEGRLTEQWRCENADKLEPADQLLARIRKERETCHQQQLKDWKAGVEKWEAEGKPGKKPRKPRKSKSPPEKISDDFTWLPTIPETWRWNYLGWMTLGIKYGTSAKSKPSGDVPVIRMGNIKNGEIDWENLVFTSDPEEAAQYSLQDGDVLFNRTNSPELVGKTGLFRGKRKAIFAGYLMRINHLRELIDSRYLNYFLNSTVAINHGAAVRTDAVNQSNINAEKLMHYPFPYCSHEEQIEIAERLDAELSKIAYMDESITTTLQQAETLRQSILKRAFEGKLVPQDPDDEPATKLLARIRAER